MYDASPGSIAASHHEAAVHAWGVLIHIAGIARLRGEVFRAGRVARVTAGIAAALALFTAGEQKKGRADNECTHWGLRGGILAEACLRRKRGNAEL